MKEEEIKKMAYEAYPISDRPSPEEMHDKGLLQEGYIRAYNDLEYTSRFRRLSLPMVERIVILAQTVEEDFCDDEERTFYGTEDIAREVIKRLEEEGMYKTE